MKILKAISDSTSKRLIISSSLEGVCFETDNCKLNKTNDDRNIAKLKAQIKALEEAQYIEALNADKSIYGLTDMGYILLEDNQR